MTGQHHETASVRYIVDDVRAATDFYTAHLGFSITAAYPPALLNSSAARCDCSLSGPSSTGAKATPEDAAAPGRNRIHLIVDDLDAAIDGLRTAGVDSFRSEPLIGFGGNQILLADPAGNLIEL